METANQETLERKTMANLPKLKVEGLGWEESKGICEFDQARFFPYHQGDLVIVAEQQVVRSYEELVELAGREAHKNKEYLEVLMVPVLTGG